MLWVYNPCKVDLLKRKERRERKKVREFLAALSPSERLRLLTLFAEMMQRESKKAHASVATAQIPTGESTTYSWPFPGIKLP